MDSKIPYDALDEGIREAVRILAANAQRQKVDKLKKMGDFRYSSVLSPRRSGS